MTVVVEEQPVKFCPDRGHINRAPITTLPEPYHPLCVCVIRGGHSSSSSSPLPSQVEGHWFPLLGSLFPSACLHRAAQVLHTLCVHLERVSVMLSSQIWHCLLRREGGGGEHDVAHYAWDAPRDAPGPRGRRACSRRVRCRAGRRPASFVSVHPRLARHPTKRGLCRTMLTTPAPGLISST